MIDDDERTEDDKVIHRMTHDLTRSYQRSLLKGALALLGAAGAVSAGATLAWLLLT